MGDQPQFETLPPQNDQSEVPSHLSGICGSKLASFHGFFLAATMPMGQPENNNCEKRESVHLNYGLKMDLL
ncbi:hypothetical protein HanPSC8_Chr01g0033401 [Helianthus annuus]|nr:hypothetical protein HanIR_Chr01g0038121 [Helianthus annuus]KAJ0957934.1 hypothetical protein HanPSC8_Chr01g0033401 [Helianthus annuus]